MSQVQNKDQQQDGGNDKNIDVTRSQHQQAQAVAAESNDTGEESRPEGSEEKETPAHHHGSHQEGQYDKQSDDPTMRPSGIDNES